MSELPPGWAATTMGEVCQVVGGSTPKTSVAQYWGNEIAWITPDDLSKHSGKHIEHGARFISAEGYESCSTRMMPAGSVLFTSRAPIGYVAIASGPVCTNQGFKSFIPPTGVLSDYLYWYLQFATPRIREMGSGTTFKEISGKVTKSIPLLLPPAPEQRRIVEAIEEQFSRLDAGVESLQRARRNHARLRAAILQAAVEGRLVPQDPDDEPAEMLLRASLEDRRAAWESEALVEFEAKGRAPKSDSWRSKYKEPATPRGEYEGSLPMGWVLATPEQLAARQAHALAIGPFGSNLKVSDYASQGVPLVFVRNIRSARFAGPETKFVSDAKAEELEAHLVRQGDLLITKMGDPPGDAAIYTAAHPAIITADCIKLTPHASFDVRYLELAMNSSPVRRQVLRITKGVAQLKVSLARFRSELSIPLPPRDEQQRIVSEVERRFSILDALEQAIARGLNRSAMLRQVILREAFAGQLVPQDPSDEPASALLQRIRVERAKA